MANENKRSRNFSHDEVSYLVKKKYSKIVENKESGAVSFKQKNAAWIELTKQYNAEMGGQPRCHKVLKEKWNNLKRNTSKSIGSIKKQIGGTGGGPLLTKD